MAGKIELKAPLDGVVTIEPEDTASNFTVTIPAVTSTLVNEASDIEAQVKTATNATGGAPIFSCRAWCNFDGTGTVAITGSGNVSSITDNGTGDYTVNFTVAMPDVNYCAVALSGGVSGGSYITSIDQVTARSTTSIRVATLATAGGNQDATAVELAIFR